MSLSKQELIEAVKAHAARKYNKYGWDIVVECWSDDEIGKAIGKCTTVHGAVMKVYHANQPAVGNRAEVEATVW